MNTGHIKFEVLSDYCDNELSAEEKNFVKDHLETCPICGVEYERLTRTISFSSCSCKGLCAGYQLSQHTLWVYKTRQRKKAVARLMPAAAAVFFFVVGTGIYNANFMTGAGSFAGMSDTEKIVNTIRDSKARILDMGDEYIEGEIKVADFKKLRNNLGSRKIEFQAVNSSSAFMPVSPVNEFAEEVRFSDDHDTLSVPRNYASVDRADYIRFRIYNKGR